MSANSTPPLASSPGPENTASSPRIGRIVLDIAVAALLLGVLFVVYSVESRATSVVENVPPVTLPPDPEPEPEPLPEPPTVEPVQEPPPPIDPVRRIQVQLAKDSRFGVSTTTGNPDDPSDDNKKLTFAVEGVTNNTRLWVDGASPMFGSGEGKIVRAASQLDNGRTEAEWEYNDIQVLQSTEFIGGEVSRRTDTLRVDYRIKNVGATERTVGLRVMLDSLIGNNDGVPFIVPGREQIVTSPQSFRGESVPDFVRALETADLVNPGVIADLGLRPADGERPSEVVLTRWPGGQASWDYDRTRPFGNDTAIGVYYQPRPLPPGGERTVSFTYGIGTISSTKTKNARISLTAGGPFRSGGKFWLVALVQEPRDGQRVHLELPAGFKFDAAHPATKPVPAGTGYTQLSWLIEISPATFGAAEVKATLEPDQVEELCQLAVQPRDARLTLIAIEPIRSGKTFWVSAIVQHAKDGQTVELKMSNGLKLAKGHDNIKPVPRNEGYSRINWLVEVPTRTTGTAEISARLNPEGAQESTTVTIQSGNLID